MAGKHEVGNGPCHDGHSHETSERFYLRPATTSRHLILLRGNVALNSSGPIRGSRRELRTAVRLPCAYAAAAHAACWPYCCGSWCVARPPPFSCFSCSVAELP